MLILTSNSRNADRIDNDMHCATPIHCPGFPFLSVLATFAALTKIIIQPRQKNTKDKRGKRMIYKCIRIK